MPSISLVSLSVFLLFCTFCSGRFTVPVGFGGLPPAPVANFGRGPYFKCEVCNGKQPTRTIGGIAILGYNNNIGVSCVEAVNALRNGLVPDAARQCGVIKAPQGGNIGAVCGCQNDRTTTRPSPPSFQPNPRPSPSTPSWGNRPNFQPNFNNNNNNNNNNPKPSTSTPSWGNQPSPNFQPNTRPSTSSSTPSWGNKQPSFQPNTKPSGSTPSWGSQPSWSKPSPIIRFNAESVVSDDDEFFGGEMMTTTTSSSSSSSSNSVAIASLALLTCVLVLVIGVLLVLLFK